MKTDNRNIWKNICNIKEISLINDYFQMRGGHEVLFQWCARWLHGCLLVNNNESHGLRKEKLEIILAPERLEKRGVK